tara:strand:- start:15 stop:494 length:480 start_codon:yes stop_codon:yes gene_type:complete
MKSIYFIILLTCLFILSCNSVRESAGVNRKVIDEYKVVENPPLVIPPDFNLPPPDQIEAKEIDDTDSELAKEILFGLEDNNNKVETDNSVMSDILNEVQTENIDENIRESINEEFAGEKSTIYDETNFKNEEEINEAIETTKSNEEKTNINKKKRFFFF